MKTRNVICIIYWDLGIGGIQKRIRDLVNDLATRYPDWEAFILLRRKGSDGFYSQIVPKKNVHIHVYPHQGGLRVPLGFIFWTAWMYIKIRPTVVLTFQCLLSALCVALKKVIYWNPVSLVLNEGAVSSIATDFENILGARLLIGLFYRYSDSIIVPTIACRSDLIHTYKVPGKIITVIPNWTLFKTPKDSRKVIDILYVGRFSREKNPEYVISLAKQLYRSFPFLRISMVGSGPDLQMLRQRIRREKMAGCIKIFPFSNNIQSFYAKAKILLVPSHNEGMPNVVLEAAVCRVPAVVNNFPGAHEVVVHNKTGYIYNSGSESVFYITELLNKEPVRRRLGNKAKKYYNSTIFHARQRAFISQLIPSAM